MHIILDERYELIWCSYDDDDDDDDCDDVHFIDGNSGDDCNIGKQIIIMVVMMIMIYIIMAIMKNVFYNIKNLVLFHDQ